MYKRDIKKIEKILDVLKTIPKENRYIMYSPVKFKEINTNSGFEISSNGYIVAWDKDGNKHWFKPEQLYTLKEVKLKVETNRMSSIKSTIRMKQTQIQGLEKEILQLKEELEQ